MNFDNAQKNIFKFDNPQTWWCRVSGLASAHSILQIDVVRLQEGDKPYFNEVMYLDFRKVAHFSGWFTWTDVYFRKAELAEKAQFIRSVSPPIYTDSSDDEIAFSSEFATYSLFISEGRDGKITHILANAARLRDKNNHTLIEAG